MIVKVYLSCCGGAKVLDAVKEAVRLSETGATIETVSDFAEVAKAGIISTPAIKINDQIVASGRTPKMEDLVALLKSAAVKTKKT